MIDSMIDSVRLLLAVHTVLSEASSEMRTFLCTVFIETSRSSQKGLPCILSGIKEHSARTLQMGPIVLTIFANNRQSCEVMCCQKQGHQYSKLSSEITVSLKERDSTMTIKLALHLFVLTCWSSAEISWCHSTHTFMARLANSACSCITSCLPHKWCRYHRSNILQAQ